MKHLMTLLAALVLFTGCAPDPNELGIVATVNGRPIYMSELEYMYDLEHMDEAKPSIPSVDEISREYGGIMAELIVQQLVYQELEKHGMSVTDEEVGAAEEDIRQDYPGESFEQILVEEYIDLNNWREQLRYRVALEKFHQQVLRPTVKIGYDEAKAYYKDNLADFVLPERLRLVQVRGEKRADVQAAAKDYLKTGNRTRVEEEHGAVDLREILIAAANLPPLWEHGVRNLKPGSVSNPIPANGGFEVLVYLKTVPAKVVPPGQAYTVIENILLQEKLKQAFDSWLEEALATAEIRISRHLIQQETGENGEAVPPDS